MISSNVSASRLPLMYNILYTLFLVEVVWSKVKCFHLLCMFSGSKNNTYMLLLAADIWLKKCLNWTSINYNGQWSFFVKLYINSNQITIIIFHLPDWRSFNIIVFPQYLTKPMPFYFQSNILMHKTNKYCRFL